MGALRITTKCQTIDDLIALFARYTDETSLFVAMKTPWPVAERQAFQLRLVDGSIVMQGDAEIVESTPLAEGVVRPGMRIRLHQLDDPGKILHAKLLAARAALEGGAPPRAETQSDFAQVEDSGVRIPPEALFDRTTPAASPGSLATNVAPAALAAPVSVAALPPPGPRSALAGAQPTPPGPAIPAPPIVSTAPGIPAAPLTPAVPAVPAAPILPRPPRPVAGWEPAVPKPAPAPMAPTALPAPPTPPPTAPTALPTPPTPPLAPPTPPPAPPTPPPAPPTPPPAPPTPPPAGSQPPRDPTGKAGPGFRRPGTARPATEASTGTTGLETAWQGSPPVAGDDEYLPEPDRRPRLVLGASTGAAGLVLGLLLGYGIWGGRRAPAPALSAAGGPTSLASAPGAEAPAPTAPAAAPSADSSPPLGAAPPPPPRCKLSVTSTPPRADVLVDGQRLGPTPLTDVDVPCQTVTIALVHPRYERIERSVTPTADAPTRLDERLARPIGTLELRSVPPGAVATIDGNPAGKTPLTADVEVFSGHTVKLVAPGYRPWIKKIALKGKRLRVDARLDKERRRR
jgi:hypothetical protein